MTTPASEPTPRVAVVTFPGSNDDADAALALAALGADPIRVWHGESELPEDVVLRTRSKYVEAFELLTKIPFEQYVEHPDVVLG